MAICTFQQSFQFQINSFTLLSCTVPGVHQWGTPESILDKTMISGLASSRDQASAFGTLRSNKQTAKELRKQPSFLLNSLSNFRSTLSHFFHATHSSWRTPMRNSWINLRQNHDQRVSKFKRSGQWVSKFKRSGQRIWHAEKSRNQESTNKQQRSFESNHPSSDRKHNDGPCRQANHDVWFETGEKRMRTPTSEHAHNWAQKFKNACAHWHSTDLRGHDDPWTRRTRTALTGTEREVSEHWLLESVSAAALRTNVNVVSSTSSRCGRSRRRRRSMDQKTSTSAKYRSNVGHGYYCRVPKCVHQKATSPSLSFHAFPSSIFLALKFIEHWIHAIRRDVGRIQGDEQHESLFCPFSWVGLSCLGVRRHSSSSELWKEEFGAQRSTVDLWVE